MVTAWNACDDHESRSALRERERAVSVDELAQCASSLCPHEDRETFRPIFSKLYPPSSLYIFRSGA